ncbi:MAG: AAA family ATPase, partial [Bacteroides sp.]
MDTIRKLPLGFQDFEDLRRRNNLYVDKTPYLAKLVSRYKAFLLCRPHRFGKSLFLSTLRAYFEGKKELFAGLYIEQAEATIARQQNREPWEKHPVLYFDLNAKVYNNAEALRDRLLLQLDLSARKYGVELRWESPYDQFVYLINQLYQLTGKQVVILIDEYDKPLLETVLDEALNEAIRSQLKSFFEVLKQCDRYICFALLTGVTKFSKINLFSGANQLMDISLSDEYAAICGFTEQELKQHLTPEIEALAAAQKSSVEKTLETLKKKYDGYCFASSGEHVYNPFSLLNVLANSSYGYYWFETATPTYLVNYIKRKQEFIPEFDNDLTIGVNDVQDFRYNDDDAIVPLLFQSGYLTIKKYMASAGILRLGYPNEEVRFGFLKELIPHYSSRLTRTNVAPTIWNLYEWLNSGNLVDTMKLVEEVLAGILYGNIPNNETGRPLREQYYQSVLYAVFRLLGLHAQSEVVCASG